MSKIKIQLYNHMVLDHAKFDAMMLGCCGWLPGCCYVVVNC